MNKKETILVEIAAYKETELLNTVNSALIQAEYPDRIHFAICYQSDDKKDYNELLKIKNCRIKYMKEKDAKGLCYARYLCQKMIKDEDYILQIDSHMRFVKKWDTNLINQLIDTKDDHAIISFYPADCKTLMDKKLDDPIFDKPTESYIIKAEKFREYPSYYISYYSNPNKNKDIKYKKTPFISGGYFFSYSKVHKEVINDPNMFFYGDELSMAIRLYTYGWNIYVPNEGYIYHQYSRVNSSSPEANIPMAEENRRHRNLIGIDHDTNLGEFGLGNKRTLKEFESFSGINFKERILTPKAKTASFELNKKSNFKEKKNKIDKTTILKEKEEIDVVIVDIYHNYNDCIKKCLENSDHKEKIHFIVGTTDKITSKKELKELQIESITQFKEEDNYCKILSKITKNLKHETTAIIDSSYLFFKGWDTYNLKEYLKCGTNALLTSWIWYADTEEKRKNVEIYKNLIYECNKYEDYLPSLIYKKIDYTKRKNPYQVAFHHDGFYFGSSYIFKKVPFDPSLNPKEQDAVYALRLWTHGINLYVPASSYFMRTKDYYEIEKNNKHYSIVCGLYQNKNKDARELPDNYYYGYGEERPVWTFFEYTHIYDDFFDK